MRSSIVDRSLGTIMMGLYIESTGIVRTKGIYPAQHSGILIHCIVIIGEELTGITTHVLYSAELAIKDIK